MMRRYIGRAHGTRRKPKPKKSLLLWQRNKEPFVWALVISAALLGLVLIAVLIMNPGADRGQPDDERGSMSPTSVLPTGPSDDPSGR